MGYQVSNVESLHKGLKQISLPKADYAIFSSKGDSGTFLAETWKKRTNSTMALEGKHKVEVYSFKDDDTIVKTELHIEL